MNSNLDSDIQSIGKTLFIDCQNHNKEMANRIFTNAIKEPNNISFWANVNSFFSKNDVSTKILDGIPCSFTPMSPSVGQHRQHAYIKDIKGNLFQIDALYHRKHLSSFSCDYSLGAVAHAMIIQNEIGIDQWFDKYRTHSIKRFKSLLTYFIKELKESFEPEKDISTFYSSFFFWNLYSHERDIHDYSFSDSFDLKDLWIISFNINKEQYSVKDFIRAAQDIIDKKYIS